MLRRLKRDVLTELPDLTEQTLYTEMEPAHARLMRNAAAIIRTLSASR